jgi:hypothetical protein
MPENGESVKLPMVAVSVQNRVGEHDIATSGWLKCQEYGIA